MEDLATRHGFTKTILVERHYEDWDYRSWERRGHAGKSLVPARTRRLFWCETS